MSTATITQAQNKGLRHQLADSFGKIRAFAVELYAAHGGWIAHQGERGQDGRRQLMSLAAAAESHSPALSAELRKLASK